MGQLAAELTLRAMSELPSEAARCTERAWATAGEVIGQLTETRLLLDAMRMRR
jgi:hypothetical protein